ncbi:NAD-dependent epimerase, partial [Vibrio parahaemolyticus]|nr:NAD-dependent epimerase [Vibrio parahaemolyticus]NMS08231.1 NAD-dependent epimerase [Vibrio parahaemolyticus]
LRLAGRFNQTTRDAAELLPRYESDNLVVSDKFQTRFPDFQITTFEQGLTTIQQEKANDQKPL